MPKELTRDQYWELFQKLPNEIKTLILSEETAKDIFDICDRNEVDIEKISEVADYTGRILLGALPPEDFQKVLEEKMKLEKKQAKKVAQEINRFIFYPVRNILKELYRIEITPSKKVIPAAKVTPLPEEKLATPAVEEKPSAPPRKDIYREPIE